MRKVIGKNISGTDRRRDRRGKEMLAQAIHLDSPRRAGPFVAANCASLPETLIESELCGYAQGALHGFASRDAYPVSPERCRWRRSGEGAARASCRNDACRSTEIFLFFKLIKRYERAPTTSRLTRLAGVFANHRRGTILLHEVALTTTARSWRRASIPSASRF